jgi:hypothetical protein
MADGRQADWREREREDGASARQVRKPGASAGTRVRSPGAGRAGVGNCSPVRAGLASATAQPCAAGLVSATPQQR